MAWTVMPRIELSSSSREGRRQLVYDRAAKIRVLLFRGWSNMESSDCRSLPCRVNKDLLCFRRQERGIKFRKCLLSSRMSWGSFILRLSRRVSSVDVPSRGGIPWRADDLIFDFETCPNYQKWSKFSNKSTTAMQNLSYVRHWIPIPNPEWR